MHIKHCVELDHFNVFSCQIEGLATKVTRNCDRLPVIVRLGQTSDILVRGARFCVDNLRMDHAQNEVVWSSMMLLLLLHLI